MFSRFQIFRSLAARGHLALPGQRGHGAVQHLRHGVVVVLFCLFQFFKNVLQLCIMGVFCCTAVFFRAQLFLVLHVLQKALLFFGECHGTHFLSGFAGSISACRAFYVTGESFCLRRPPGPAVFHRGPRGYSRRPFTSFMRERMVLQQHAVTPGKGSITSRISASISSALAATACTCSLLLPVTR